MKPKYVADKWNPLKIAAGILLLLVAFVVSAPCAEAQPQEVGQVQGGERLKGRFRRLLEEGRDGDRGGPQGGGPRAAGSPGGVPESPEEPEGPGRQLLRGIGINKYLQFSENFVSSVSDPHRAIGLAALGIRDAYRRQGKPADAVPVFEELLSTTKDQTDRNIYLFLIRQTHQESNDMAKFLEVNRQIIKENTAK